MKIKKAIKDILWVIFALPFWIMFTIIYSIFSSNDYKKYITEEDKNGK